MPSERVRIAARISLGRLVESFAGFDFEDQTETLTVKPFQATEESAHVGFGADERKADEISVLDDKGQRGSVAVIKRGNIDLCFG